jgi:hypothetical protein
MDPPDDDIQFDFFEDEPVTVEASAARRGAPQRRAPDRQARRPRAPARPPATLKPVVTLGAAVFLLIFIFLFFAVVISACAGASRGSTYGSYIDKVTTIASQSTTDGKQTVQALTTPGLTVAKIVSTLDTIAAAEQQNVQAAEGLNAPGRLREANTHLIEALELRVSGVSGLATAFQATIGSKEPSSAEANTLSGQAYRLLASDVVWDDLFQKPAQDQINNDGVRQVTVPASTFLPQPDAFASPHAMSFVLSRIAGNSGPSKTPSGLHGTDLVSVEALPNGSSSGTVETLKAGVLNTISTSSSLVIKVTIHDGGISQEVEIPITLTIPQSSGTPITRTQKVQLIDPGGDASVTFSDLGQVPFGATKSTLRVDVAAVPGETNLANNSAAYDVIFSLPQ